MDTKTKRRRKKPAQSVKLPQPEERGPGKGVHSGPPRKFMVADLFCGAGGTSTGATQAITSLGAEMELVAVNHWATAVATHSRNHPQARHFVQDLDGADPETLVPEGRLDLLMASPECRFFSRARGGKPVQEQGRMSPWIINRWLTSLDVNSVICENVPEFQNWGPVVDGRPDKDRKGQYFEAWVRSLWEIGYTVEWRLLNAADFGDATSRVRFFLQARKDGVPIRWPEPSHSKTGGNTMLGELPKWRGAREIIDWSDLGRSLLDDPKYKRRPLSINTRRRIARGLHRFGGPLAPYYIRLLDLDDDSVESISKEPVSTGHTLGFHGSNRQNTAPRGMDEPVPTVTTWGAGGAYMVQPLAAPLVGANRNHNVPQAVDQPVPVITTGGGGGCYIVQPSVQAFVLGQQSGSSPRAATEPIPTIAAAGAISMIRPMIVEYYGNGGARPVSDPLTTATTKARHALAQPTVVPAVDQDTPDGDNNPTDIAKPEAHACIIPNFGERDNQAPRIHDIGSPTPAVTSRGAGNLLTPLASEVTKKEIEGVDPRRLVLINGRMHILDIRFRMLQNLELARAMGFSDEEQQYEFVGNTSEVTKQIGNAVPVNLAAALVSAVLGSEHQDVDEEVTKAVA